MEDPTKNLRAKEKVLVQIEGWMIHGGT